MSATAAGIHLTKQIGDRPHLASCSISISA